MNVRKTWKVMKGEALLRGNILMEVDVGSLN